MRWFTVDGGSFHVLYLAVLVSIAFLWRPAANNTRYALCMQSYDVWHSPCHDTVFIGPTPRRLADAAAGGTQSRDGAVGHG